MYCFVSVEAAERGTLTTTTFVLIGDRTEVNADATGGSVRVEAFHPDGSVIEGFWAAASDPLTTNSLRHVLRWTNSPDCRPTQARPIKLRFQLDKAKLYSFRPRIRSNHYSPTI